MARIAAAALSLGLAALGACGGGMEPSRAPADPAASPGAYPAPTTMMDQPTTVDGAAASLDQAEMELNRAIPTGAAPFASPPGQPGATPLSEGDACTIACQALASMQRAASHLCELAGEGERCDAAKARVQTASDRVQQACPGCAG
jgi:hypothetical protein